MARLPVYVFIQGGAFNGNSKPHVDGTGLIQASGMKMIVVTLNYRVSVFGFLAHGNKVQPNIGLLDQRKALQWVQRYISRFGGNPRHVVLGGNSSGAASVAFHLTMYGGRDDKLFHAASAESISASPIVTMDQAAYRADNIMTKLGCTDGDVMACMRNKTVYEISTVNINYLAPGSTKTPISMWMPVVDGDVVRSGLWDAFNQGNFVRVPTIIGATTNEGVGFTPAVSSQSEVDNFWQAEYPRMNSTHMSSITALYSDLTTGCDNAGCFTKQLQSSYGDM
jgi:carboxylesterase type B